MGLLTTNSCWKEKGEDYFDYYLFDRLKIKKDEMHAVMPKYKKSVVNLVSFIKVIIVKS